MSRQILVLGATGMLGQPVVRCLAEHGNHVRVLARNVDKARRMFGSSVEIVEGSALDRDSVRTAISGCHAVHISLTQESELTATQHVVDLTPGTTIERIAYISATTACEENRWFEVIDVKMRTEEILGSSGIPHTVFCPTWVMETLPNFIHGDRAAVILGRKPPALHFFAAADFGRMIAASYDDDRALGKRLFIHGPEGITLANALERFVDACHPEIKLMRMKLWQARLFATLTGRKGLSYVTRLIAYFDKVGELGDPTEANALFGAPSKTLGQWLEERQSNARGPDG
ncbi:MAG: NmrA family NAD(P)-binding protein [Gemmatimonadota bacterium]|nr:MAG: NmrA family NAD(P)-binding protein [Gemmatimonadota bacterium]